ncbi:MAG: protein kinase [Acidobacteriota bacterium]
MSKARRRSRLSALRPGLLARLVLALLLVGLLPLGVTWLQLQHQQDALVEQVQRTHSVAAATAAARAATVASRATELADSLAAHPALADPASTAAQELLRGSLQARDDVLAVGLFGAVGETLVQARREPVDAAFASILAADDDLLVLDRPSTAGSSSGHLLATRRGLAQGRTLALVTTGNELADVLEPIQLGEEAHALLVSDSLEVLAAGSAADTGTDAQRLAGLPTDLLEQARSGRVGSGVRVVRGAEGSAQDLVVAFARVDEAPWFVLSTQPPRVAEVARARFLAAGQQAALLAGALTAVLALLAWLTVVQPLQRLAAAQRELVGEVEGDEIHQLERSFALLRQRVHEQNDLGEVFLGRYQVAGLVGSGAMGSVFRGWDDKLARPVALKTIHLDAAAIDAGRLADSLRQEAAMTARMSQPNIVTIYDIEEQGNSAFIAMELVDGINLRSLLRARHRLHPDQAAPLLLELARGLATAHKHDLVHHDVKPANVLLGRDGAVKLTDFGISQTISSATRSEQVICGTPGYIAPEVLEGGDYGPAADLWALGVIGYECIVGENPFRGPDLAATVMRTMTLGPPNPLRTVPETEERLARLLQQMMALEPGERPSSSDLVVEALDTLCAERSLRWRAELDIELQGEAPSPPPPSARGTRLMTRAGVPVDGLSASLDDDEPTHPTRPNRRTQPIDHR